MGYLLLIFLVIELLMFYNFNGKNVVSPSFIGCAVFILSTAIYLSAEDYYGYEIHGGTVAVILGLLVCIFIGERFADVLRGKDPNKNHHQDIQRHQNPVIVSRVMCTLLSVGVLVIAVMHFYATYQYSITVGNIERDIFSMAKYTREAVYNGYDPLDLPFYINQGVVVSECLVWFCVYSICINKNFTGKFYFRYLIPIVCYLPNVWATDNRTALLRMMVICFIIVFVLIKQRYGWTTRSNMKIIVIGLFVIGIYILVFRMLGYRTDTSLRNEFSYNITEYMSASLVGFDKYLQNGEAPNILFGQGTLKNIYNILRQWGMPIPEVERFELFYKYAQGESNIYTTFKSYIKDYTIVGAAIAMFLWGAVINYSINYIRKNGAGFIRMCIIGMMFYPVLMLSIEDTTSTFLGISTLYTLVYLTIINEVLIKKSIRVCW